MADDTSDWEKRLKALQNKQDPSTINKNDLDNRLSKLTAYQKKDVDPNATQNDLWNRLNKLDEMNVNNDINPYQPSIQNKNKQKIQKSKFAEHKTDALMNRLADEINLEKTIPNGDIDFDVDDELDDIDDPNLMAFMAEVNNDLNNKKNVKMPQNEDWKNMLKNAENNAKFTKKDEKLMNEAMNEIPSDILKESKNYADKKYKAYKEKEKMYQKMGKMGIDPDEYLNQIMGDSDNSDSDVNDVAVKALIDAAKDEAALEDKFGAVKMPKESKKGKKKCKNKNEDEDEDEYWDSYADYDSPKKKKKKRRGFGW